MKLASIQCRAAFVLLLVARTAAAQGWRQTAAGIGTTARVLIIGAHPEDEDNALIAWLSLGRNIETAYLSLTRGESGPNIVGNERQSPLGVVRTAELLAERRRDGAHQYFTRAYDFGFTQSDSIVAAAWPHDSLLKDVVSVVRAFRPHVIISLFSDSAEPNAAHRLATQLAREAFFAASDTLHFPAAETSLLHAWTVSRLLTRIDSAAPGMVTIDVGEFNRDRGRSYAEIGAEIRQLQRTQPPLPAPNVGPVWRRFRLDSARVGDDGPGLFGNVDTTWARFRTAVPVNTQIRLDSLRSIVDDVRTLALAGSDDSLAVALARVVQRAANVRAAFTCAAFADIPLCSGALSDLAVSLDGIRERATHAFMGAAGLIIDGTVEQALVAAGDSTPLTVTVFNGGTLPVVIRRLSASRSALTHDSTVVGPDSVAHWLANLPMTFASAPWWQINGLVTGTWIHRFATRRGLSLVPQLISGEDRLPTSGVEAIVAIAGIDVRVGDEPIVYRSPGVLRGDDRHPLTGMTALSVLFEHTAEYERADMTINRMLRVYLSSVRSTSDTVTVTIQLPPGFKADSASRVVIVPAFGTRNVFFHLRGTLKAGTDAVVATARIAAPTPTSQSSTSRSFEGTYAYGAILHDYPHIPSQQFTRLASVRLEVVNLRVPPRLRVAYIKGGGDLQPSLSELRVNFQALDPSTLPVVDLSAFTTVLVNADALASDALAGTLPALHDFMRKGGTMVVLPGQTAIVPSGLLPYLISFDSVPGRVSDPKAAVRVTDPKSPLLNWPNVITGKDFEEWSEERARNVPATFDPHYHAPLSMGDAGQAPTAATILVAPVGRGTIVYTSLSLDRQLEAVNPGAARLFVNLLAAGLRTGKD